MAERHREDIRKFADTLSWPPAANEDLRPLFMNVGEMISTSGIFTQDTAQALVDAYDKNMEEPVNIKFRIDPEKMEIINKMREQKYHMFTDYAEISNLIYMIPESSQIPRIELEVLVRTRGKERSEEIRRNYYVIKYLGQDAYEGFHQTTNELITTGDVQLIELALVQLQTELSAV